MNHSRFFGERANEIPTYSVFYGYPGYLGGKRHSLLEDDITVYFKDTKFRLVSFSTFFNYLEVKNKTGINNSYAQQCPSEYCA